MEGQVNELALFAGIGGGILGGHLLGWRTVCAVERDAYCAAVLAQRQNDGILRPFPIWSDVETFDGRPWRGVVDVVSGGFPCQDISVAGKGAGIDGERSGLWREMSRIIGEVRPRFAFVENSPRLIRLGLARVLGDLAKMGYDATWGVFSAEEAIFRQSPTPAFYHERDRLFVLAADAHSVNDDERRYGAGKVLGSRHPEAVIRGSEETADAGCRRRETRSTRRRVPGERGRAVESNGFGGWWDVEPGVGRVVHGGSCRVDRIASLGNAQVPAVVRVAWIELMARLELAGMGGGE
jgi:DNA (cytosine-5)-methyltransferase 1